MFCGLSLATVQAFLVPSHKLSMILLSTTLATVLPIRPIHSNKSTAALIATPAIPQFFRQENYLLSGWNKISSQAVLQRYFVTMAFHPRMIYQPYYPLPPTHPTMVLTYALALVALQRLSWPTTPPTVGGLPPNDGTSIRCIHQYTDVWTN